MVQKPWEKLQTALIFVGPQGCGKTSVVQPYFDMFGSNAVLLESLDYLVGHFNALSQGRVLIFLEEIKTKKTSDLGKFKNAITGKKRTIEQKYKDAGSSTDYSHYIACTDNPNNLAFQERNRRYALIDCGALVFDDEESKVRYFYDYYGAMQADEGYVSCALYHYLLARNLQGFNVVQEPPRSAMCEMMQVADENSISAWWRQCLERGYHCHLSEVIDQNDLGLQNFTSKRGRCVERMGENEIVFGDTLNPAKMPPDYNPWIEEISQEDLFMNYSKWCTEKQIRAMYKVNWIKNVGWFVKILSQPRHRIKTSNNPNSLRNYYQLDCIEKCIQMYNMRVDTKIGKRKEDWELPPSKRVLEFIELPEYVQE